MTCTNKLRGEQGVCTHCREWTEVCEPCCGSSVWFEGDRVHGVDAYHDCGCESCLASCLAIGCLECEAKVAAKEPA